MISDNDSKITNDDNVVEEINNFFANKIIFLIEYYF